jgi:predicted HicB family RNase H-like nuclease
MTVIALDNKRRAIGRPRKAPDQKRVSLSLRIPRALRAELVAAAGEEQRSLTQFCERALWAFLEARRRVREGRSRGQ